MNLENAMIGDRFVLRERVGSGGFGVVHRGDQRVLGRPIRRVAIKVSHAAGLSEEAAREQLDEALLLARAMDEMTDATARSRLVPVYDAGLAGELDARSYLVTEYVQGTTLAAQFRSYERVPVRLLLRWVRQLAEALRALHALVPPVLHRDIKPDNVLLGIDRGVRLADFGLAARLVTAGYLPGVAGTLAYMAPETAQGDSAPVSDVYSLGLLLYEGLTGGHAYAHLVPPAGLPPSEHRYWLYTARRDGPPDPPSARNATVAPALDDLTLACLEFEPGDRPRAADLVDLIDHLDDRPAAEPEGALDEARRMRAEGDDARAVRTLERALAAGGGAPPERFALLDELGGMLLAQDDPGRAARRYAEAWDVVRAHGALLRSRQERAAYAGKTAAAYDRAGNAYQADRFARIRDHELGGGPR